MKEVLGLEFYRYCLNVSKTVRYWACLGLGVRYRTCNCVMIGTADQKHVDEVVNIVCEEKYKI